MKNLGPNFSTESPKDTEARTTLGGTGHRPVVAGNLPGTPVPPPTEIQKAIEILRTIQHSKIYNGGTELLVEAAIIILQRIETGARNDFP